MTDATDVTAKGKASKCERTFGFKDGSKAARTNVGVDSVHFRFPENGTTLDMNLDELSDDIIRAAAAFGVNTSVGNSFGALSDPVEALRVAEERWETLKTGIWASERQTGPGTSDILEALIRMAADGGKIVDEAGRERLRHKIAAAGESVKTWTADAQLNAHVLAIRQERAERKAEEAAEKAKSAPKSTLDLNSLLA